MDPLKQDALKKRINRIAGQVEGIGRMVDSGRYCVDILDQIAAVRSALNNVGIELLTNHIEGCVAGHGTQSEHPDAIAKSPEELVAEVQSTLARFLK